MIYIKYILLVPISLILTIISIPLSIVLPLFAIQKDGWLDNHSAWGIGPRLPNWLNWFMTPDNSLDGDYTFQQINGRSYLAKVKWLLRNPAYSFGLRYIDGFSPAYWKGDRTIRDNDNAKEGSLYVKAGGLFQIVIIKRIFSSSRCIYVNFGWNIRALVDPNVSPTATYQATFAFSPRISGFR